jgi:hypothetical protein
MYCPVFEFYSFIKIWCYILRERFHLTILPPKASALNISNVNVS